MWFEFVVGSYLALRFFLGSLVLLPLQKPASSNSNATRIAVSLAAVIRVVLVEEKRCVTTLITAAKETTRIEDPYENQLEASSLKILNLCFRLIQLESTPLCTNSLYQVAVLSTFY